MSFPLFMDVVILFVLNLPFGYWRENVRKFSLQWVLAIHLPVPVIILLRIVSGIGWGWYTYPFLVGAYFSGQYIGARLQRRFGPDATSCLVMDVYRRSNASGSDRT
jgi:hypothetical protein